MSAPPGRRGKRLLLAGLILTVVGFLGFVTEATHAALFVPICQPGAHWLGEGRCAVLWYRVLAMELLLGLGVALVVVDLAWRAHSRWRTR
jgi:hypothetical protein